MIYSKYLTSHRLSLARSLANENNALDEHHCHHRRWGSPSKPFTHLFRDRNSFVSTIVGKAVERVVFAII